MQWKPTNIISARQVCDKSLRYFNNVEDKEKKPGYHVALALDFSLNKLEECFDKIEKYNNLMDKMREDGSEKKEKEKV